MRQAALFPPLNSMTVSPNLHGSPLSAVLVSRTIKQPIELTITQFPGLFRFNLNHETLTKFDGKTFHKLALSQPCSFFHTHVLTTLFGSTAQRHKTVRGRLGKTLVQPQLCVLYLAETNSKSQMTNCRKRKHTLIVWNRKCQVVVRR